MIIMAVNFALGLGLFLVGIFLFARYVKQILSSDVKNLLKRAEGHKWFHLTLGAVIAAIVQSSSVVSSIVVGLVGGGLVSIFSGIILLAGASIGSTITAQIIAFPIMRYGPLLAAIGLVLWTFGLKGKYVKMLGIGIFSMGLLFIGLSLMTGAFTGLENASWLSGQIDYLIGYPWYMFLVGLVVTIVLQSSSVTVGVTMAMVVSGLIAPTAVIPFVIGATTGTNITVNLASLITSRSGKITARGFFVLRLTMALLIMLLLPHFAYFIGMITNDPTSARFVANTYTLFNILAAIPTFLFVKQIARIGEYLSPINEKSLDKIINHRRKNNNL